MAEAIPIFTPLVYPSLIRNATIEANQNSHFLIYIYMYICISI